MVKGSKIHAFKEWAVVRSLDLARCDKYGKGGSVCVSMGWVVVCQPQLAKLQSFVPIHCFPCVNRQSFFDTSSNGLRFVRNNVQMQPVKAMVESDGVFDGGRDVGVSVSQILPVRDTLYVCLGSDQSPQHTFCRSQSTTVHKRLPICVVRSLYLSSGVGLSTSTIGVVVRS